MSHAGIYNVDTQYRRRPSYAILFCRSPAAAAPGDWQDLWRAVFDIRSPSGYRILVSIDSRFRCGTIASAMIRNNHTCRRASEAHKSRQQIAPNLTMHVADR